MRRSPPPAKLELELAIRVGVTGTRAIPPAAERQVRAAVADVLGQVRSVVETAARASGADALWAAPLGRVVPLLRVVSPLAEGADRVVAEEALKLGFALEAILPFAQGEYERDFGDKADRFRSLLAHAGERVLALDGGRGADEWRSYEAVGRLVVRNCDLLVAIWDPEVAAKGRGGTEDTIRFAAEVDLPIWWIHAAATQPPELIETYAAFLNVGKTAPEGAARIRLDEYLTALVQPPSPTSDSGRSLLMRTVATMRHVARIPPNDLRGYLRERAPRRRGLRLYDRLMHVAARDAPFRAPEADGVPVEASALDEADVWAPLAARARRLAGRWAERSRTCRLAVVVLCAVAATAALLGVLTLVEGLYGLAAASAASAAAVALVARAARWRDRGTAYRRLAEAARIRQALARLGWRRHRPVGRNLVVQGDEWIDWYVAAVARAAPPMQGALGGARLEATRRALDRLLVAGQATHHFNRRSAAEEAARRLDDAAHTGLAVAGVCLLIAAVAGATSGTVFGLAAISLAAVAAVILAVRHIEDLDDVAADARARERLVERLEARLLAVDTARPLASQELAVDLAALLDAMRRTRR